MKLQKPDGFPGQRLFVVPRSLLKNLQTDENQPTLYPTDIGWFPKAWNHYRSRNEGCPQSILIYCLSGKGLYKDSSGHLLKVGQDEVLFIPPWVRHEYGADPDDPWSIYWVHFQGRPSTDWRGSSVEVLAVRPVDRQAVCGLFEELEWTLDRSFHISNLARGAGILHHLLAVLRYPTSPFENNLEEDPVAGVMRFMITNLALRATLKELAVRTRFSVSHFVSLFKSRTGFAPLEYWQQLRVREACRLLDEGGLRVSEVADRLGFDDPLYFSRVFRSVMQESPRNYSQRKKG